MNMIDIIYKKRQGDVLSKEEIDFFVKGYTDQTIPDYQASALLMSIFFQKLNREETYNLTSAMKNSGDTVDLSEIKGIKVDKHSTGGVGDKTTLITGPIVAACGVPIAKMSGRGLGFTGGTVDKLESVPGFRTSVESSEFISLVNSNGISVIGQTAHIAPADKKIYALRDVTATVENMSLIAASVMSKKLASGSDAIVLDVKCGKGAFMKNLEEASELGNIMVDIGNLSGKTTIAVITDMNQPLGKAVGNSNEVIEAIETLKGNGPEDITELALRLASYMIYLGEKAKSPDEGYKKAEEALYNGKALEKFKTFISSQGGQSSVCDDYKLFPQPKFYEDVILTGEMLEPSFIGCKEVYIEGIEARTIGLASQHAGAGRAKKGDPIDLSAGIFIHKKIGELALPGDVIATVCGMGKEAVVNSVNEIKKAFTFSMSPVNQNPLILKVIQK